MYFLVRNINDARATMKNRTISSEAITSSYIPTCIDIYLSKKSVNERASEQKRTCNTKVRSPCMCFSFFLCLSRFLVRMHVWFDVCIREPSERKKESHVSRSANVYKYVSQTLACTLAYELHCFSGETESN